MSHYRKLLLAVQKLVDFSPPEASDKPSANEIPEPFSCSTTSPLVVRVEGLQEGSVDIRAPKSRAKDTSVYVSKQGKDSFPDKLNHTHNPIRPRGGKTPNQR